MTKPDPNQPNQRRQGDEIGPLTPDDARALDHAWATITDADIEASIRWLDEIKHEIEHEIERQPQPQPPHHQQKETPDHD